MGELKTLRDLGMSLGWGSGGPTIDFAGFDHQMEVGKSDSGRRMGDFSR